MDNKIGRCMVGKGSLRNENKSFKPQHATTKVVGLLVGERTETNDVSEFSNLKRKSQRTAARIKEQ